METIVVGNPLKNWADYQKKQVKDLIKGVRGYQSKIACLTSAGYKVEIEPVAYFGRDTHIGSQVLRICVSILGRNGIYVHIPICT